MEYFVPFVHRLMCLCHISSAKFLYKKGQYVLVYKYCLYCYECSMVDLFLLVLLNKLPIFERSPGTIVIMVLLLSRCAMMHSNQNNKEQLVGCDISVGLYNVQISVVMYCTLFHQNVLVTSLSKVLS